MKERCIHLVLGLLFLFFCRPVRAAFGFDDVVAMAEAASARPYQKHSAKPATDLSNLEYEQYVAIRFKDANALWRADGLPFCLEFFPQGYLHVDAVDLNEIDDGIPRKIPFNPGVFDNPKNDLALAKSGGYAGFRIERNGAVLDEVGAFLDASYFRMIGRGQNYGTTARGLALNTVAKEPEEFPVFQRFWISRPGKSDDEVIIDALMDSPSVAGAYRISVHPGTTTATVVKAALFPRREITEFGIAPLTSMFLFNQDSHPAFRDFRPTVHDADGLLMHNGNGEWIWRPLETGRATMVDAYQDENPRGFGLMQRDRNFEHYQDLVARFQLRPSVWVTPSGNWGKGAVQLVQLVSDQEPFDNIVAFWVPATPPPAHQKLEVQYQIDWTTNEMTPSGLGRVSATRIGLTTAKPPHLRFVVEFGGLAVESLPESAKLSADVDFGPGVELVAKDLFKNEINQTWRLVVEVLQPARPVNIRAFLKRDERRLTESWNFTWQP